MFKKDTMDPKPREILDATADVMIRLSRMMKSKTVTYETLNHVEDDLRVAQSSLAYVKEILRGEDY